MTNFKKCKIDYCTNNSNWKAHGVGGYCAKHHAQIIRHGKIMDGEWKNEKILKEEKKCKINNCNNSANYKNHGTDGYCNKHYQQFKKFGRIIRRTSFDLNKIIDRGDYYEVCLYGESQKGTEPREVARTKIDKDDLEKIKNYKWGITSNSYVRTVINKKTILLHRLIMGNPPKNLDIDHIFFDTLDNRKNNLRLATRQQNIVNTTRKIKGYYWNKRKNKWEARLVLNKKIIKLGYFSNECDAKIARQNGEKKYFEEFARNNYHLTS